MSTATRNPSPAQARPTHSKTDNRSSVSAALSAEEAERAALRFRPMWEADVAQEPASKASSQEPASGPSKSADAVPRPSVSARAPTLRLGSYPVELAPSKPAIAPEPAPSFAPPEPSKSAAAAELLDPSDLLADGSVDSPAAPDAPLHAPASSGAVKVSSKAPPKRPSLNHDDTEGAVDIVACIPKRAPVVVRDEPSVVVAAGVSHTVQWASPSAAHLAHGSDIPLGVETTQPVILSLRKGRWVLYSVLAVAGLLLVGAGVKMLFVVGGESAVGAEPMASASSVSGVASAPAVVTQEPVAQKVEPPPVAVQSAASALASSAPPQPTRAEPQTSVASPRTAPPAVARPESRPPAKPATDSTQAAPKKKPSAPAGGIVRETPF